MGSRTVEIDIIIKRVSVCKQNEYTTCACRVSTYFSKLSYGIN